MSSLLFYWNILRRHSWLDRVRQSNFTSFFLLSYGSWFLFQFQFDPWTWIILFLHKFAIFLLFLPQHKKKTWSKIYFICLYIPKILIEFLLYDLHCPGFWWYCSQQVAKNFSQIKSTFKRTEKQEDKYFKLLHDKNEYDYGIHETYVF